MKKKVGMMWLCLACMHALWAQANPTEGSVMKIVSAWGGRSEFATTQVKKITFSGGDFQVFDTQGAAHSFAMDEIISVNFRNYPWPSSSRSILHAQDAKNSIVYPNPAWDLLYFDGNFPAHEEIRVEILGLDGKIHHSILAGTSKGSIAVSHLEAGMYICKITSPGKVSTSIFVKK